MNTQKVREELSSAFGKLGITALCNHIQNKVAFPYIRAINYHDVSPALAEQFEQQVRYYHKHFVPVDYDALIHFCQGQWPHAKPGLIITFDDGFRSFYEVIAPILEKYNYPGWFFIPVGLLEVPVEKQHEVAIASRARPLHFDYGDDRVFLTFDQLERLDEKHIIGCHTYSHIRLRSGISDEVLEREIVNAKKVLESRLNHETPIWAWVGGEEQSYSAEAAWYLKEAGFKVAFLTNKSRIRPDTHPLLLDRTNIEAHYPIELVKFLLSGFQDPFFAQRRKRVNRLILEGYASEERLLRER